MPLGPLLLFGNQQASNPGASVLTFYCNDPIASGSNAGTLQQTVPPASTSTTGWTVGTQLASPYACQVYNTEIGGAQFTATPKPDVPPVNSAEDSWRFGPSTGTFSLGTWYSSISVIAVTSGGDQDGRLRARLWRSPNPTGTPATEITASSGVMVGTTVTNLSTTVAQSSSASARIAAFFISNEYIFYQVAWEITGVGGAADRDVLVRYGSMGATDGSGLVTAAFATATLSPKGGAAYFKRRRMTDELCYADDL